MFFLVSFDLIDRRGLTPIEAGLVFLPFTLGVGLLSQPFGALADKIGARTMLIAGPLAAALAFLLLALASNASLVFGVIAPMGMLGIAFAVLITPLTASVMSAVAPADEALASGVNNAVSRVAQLAGVALSAGVASYSSGYRAGLDRRRDFFRCGGRHHCGDSCRLQRQSIGESHDPEMHARKGYPRCNAERAWLRGVPEDRLTLGAFAVMPDMRPCRLLQFDSPNKHATKHFRATGHPIIEGYDPPEGWGWCYLDETFVDLGDRTTPQRGPIPRFV